MRRQREARTGRESSKSHCDAVPASKALTKQAWPRIKAADVRAVKIVTPPTETNFACAWLAGSLDACEAAAVAYAEAVVNVAAAPKQ